MCVIRAIFIIYHTKIVHPNISLYFKQNGLIPSVTLCASNYHTDLLETSSIAHCRAQLRNLVIRFRCINLPWLLVFPGLWMCDQISVRFLGFVMRNYWSWHVNQCVLIKSELKGSSSCYFYYSSTALVKQGLLIVGNSWSHSDTSRSVRLFWTNDQPDSETSTWQHATFVRNKHQCPRRDLNPHSHQASSRRPTPETAWPLGLIT
jgi:hypothetical protein